MKAHRVVAQALAHLLAVLRQDEAIADQALEGRLVKEGCGEHHQRVEPAPRLVNACGQRQDLGIGALKTQACSIFCLMQCQK